MLDPHGRLFRLVDQACNAVHALSVELHYRACKAGVGQPTDKLD